MGFNIAIDGPAGAGKSTIAKLVAKEKGFIYVDTGALYRAMAVYHIKNQTEVDDEEKVTVANKGAKVSLHYVDGQQRVFLNDEDITQELRQEEVGNMASKIAVISSVREQLLSLQKDIARENDVVMDGRDIGTQVLPKADVKIYLTASSQARAERRYLELKEKGLGTEIEEIKRDIEERDQRDMTRETAPLKQAEDAILVDSSDMSIAEVVSAILEACNGKK